MSNRRERTLQDLCDATPTLSQPEITSILKGNFRMQGPADEENRDSLTHMVASEKNKGFSSCDRRQILDYKWKSGTCNVCSAPCSSCFHANKVLTESNEESAGETCAGDTEIGQSSVLSAVGGMDSTSDSFSENAAAKASSKTSNASASYDSLVHSKPDGQRSPEGHDDCLSCVSGTDGHANRKSGTEDSGIKYKKQSVSGDMSDKVSPGNSQTGIHSLNSGGLGHSSTKSTDDASDLLKFQTSSQASNGKYLSHDENLIDVEGNKPSNTNDEPLKGSIELFNSSTPSVLASDVCGIPQATTVDQIEKNDDLEVEIHPCNETDGSEMMEQDVKVCDICGDAGREDLLAVCCRCSDGAEHTYCMREMLDKVPEGDWLCEECKAVDQVENVKQGRMGRINKNEKNNSSGQESENLNSSDVEDRRVKGLMKIPSKRIRDDDEAEVSSIAKKPALESIDGSPKTSNSSRSTTLSLESSFKNLDRGKLQSPRHSSPDAAALVDDTTESEKSASDLRGHSSRGAFSKSNSFNSLNSKPKVKLVDQVVIQRQESAKEHSSFRLKDGAVRSIGKSMSFKSTISSHSESKTKILSPRPSHIQDIKNPKERSTVERQCSFRTEHPSNNSLTGSSLSSTSRIEKRPASRVESSSLATVTNHNELKPLRTDGKTVALSRSSSLAARKTADSSSSTGEFKRPSTYGHSNLGVSSANGSNNSEQKRNQTSVKLDTISEKSVCNAKEGLPDVLPRPNDLTDSGDRMKDYSGSRFGLPSVKSSRDESDNLKAAIEAAMLRKPGVYRKLRASGRADESSTPTVGCEVASHQDHISNARKKKLCSDTELPEGHSVARNLTADSFKEDTLNNVKQSSLPPVDGLSSRGRDGAHVGLHSRDMFHNFPAVLPLSLKSLAIPEHEYIWQGSFEICRSGQISDSWDGIQAHLSTCASPKVIEAINKFQSKIVLYEVPRTSTWPLQFQENGVKEDNIALFFFAKDLESHIKIYKVLLDNMMKNDLALRGNINGVELLIFPSNQLPDNFQRWNMLFYLWGVFRGKKESSLKQMPESINQNPAPQDIPPPIMCMPENRCSVRPITVNASKDVDPVVHASGSEELKTPLASRIKRGSGEGSSLDQLDRGLSSSNAAQSDDTKECQVRGTSQERGISSSCSPPVASSSCSGREQTSMQLDSPLDRQQSLYDSSKSSAGMPKEGIGKGTASDKTCHQDEVKKRIDARDLSSNGETPMDDSRNTTPDLNVDHSRNTTPDLNVGHSQVTAPDLNVEHSRWLFSDEELTHRGSSVVPYTIYADTTHVLPRNDDVHNERALEKINHVPSIIPKSYESAERHIFPGLDLNESAPDLELALGAETTPTPPLTLGIEPLLTSKVDQKIKVEHIPEEVEAKAEDDISASLSLSLSFPFPGKETNAKPAPKLSSSWLRGNV